MSRHAPTQRGTGRHAEPRTMILWLSETEWRVIAQALDTFAFAPDLPSTVRDHALDLHDVLIQRTS